MSRILENYLFNNSLIKTFNLSKSLLLSMSLWFTVLINCRIIIISSFFLLKCISFTVLWSKFSICVNGLKVPYLIQNAFRIVTQISVRIFNSGLLNMRFFFEFQNASLWNKTRDALWTLRTQLHPSVAPSASHSGQ